MKVCIVTYEYPPNIFGGAGTYAELLVRGLRKEGIDIYVVTHGTTNLFNLKICRINTPDFKYWRRLFFSYYASKTLNKIKDKYDFDIVHYNEPHIILSSLNKPIVSTIHSNQINDVKNKMKVKKIMTLENISEIYIKNPVGAMTDIVSAQKSNEIICPCEELKEMIHKYCFVEEKNIHVIPNGIDVSKIIIKNRENDILKKHGLKRDRYLLFMGRLDPIKGIEYLIYAFKNINLKHRELKLVIAGSGFYENFLKSIAKHTEGIIFLGHVSREEDKQSLYRNCMAVVLPSLYEALPMVVLEAMAFAKPIIASRIGGIPTIIRDCHNGFLVEPGNPRDIERCVDQLAEDTGLRREMGVRNRKLVESEYSYENMAKKTIDVYRKII